MSSWDARERECPPHLVVTGQKPAGGTDVFIRLDAVVVCVREGSSIRMVMTNGSMETMGCKTDQEAVSAFDNIVLMATGTVVKR